MSEFLTTVPSACFEEGKAEMLVLTYPALLPADLRDAQDRLRTMIESAEDCAVVIWVSTRASHIGTPARSDCSDRSKRLLTGSASTSCLRNRNGMRARPHANSISCSHRPCRERRLARSLRWSRVWASGVISPTRDAAGPLMAWRESCEICSIRLHTSGRQSREAPRAWSAWRSFGTGWAISSW
jgi:hypothetical protein